MARKVCLFGEGWSLPLCVSPVHRGLEEELMEPHEGLGVQSSLPPSWPCS